MDAQGSGHRTVWGALPRLLSGVPAWLRLALGLGLVVLGTLLITRPLSSAMVLAVLIGVSCIVSGLLDVLGARDAAPDAAPRRIAVRRIAGALWILVGVVILGWLSWSIALLPFLLAGVLAVGGIASLTAVLRGRASERVLAGVGGLVQLVFAALTVLWPELTLVVVAALFGVRTVVFGATLAVRAGFALANRDAVPVRWARRFANPLRWVAAGVLVVLAAGSVWVSAELRSGSPVVDAFYSPPADAPLTPGALLREEGWPGTPPADASVERILYTTTDLRGDPAFASAIVVVPDVLPVVPAPVLVWNHGTTGVARSCAPSLMPDMFEIQGIPAVEEAIARGWVVVATDYSGQGTPGNFPYLIGEGEARSALDGVRAARQLDGLSLSDRVAVWGHSQGGHAALWTSAIAADYAPELDIVGTVAMSPAASPLGLAKQLEASGIRGAYGVVASWVLVPYSRSYPDVRVADYVALPGRGLVYEFASRCGSSELLTSVLAASALGRDQSLYADDFTEGVFGDRLAENETLGPFPSPLFIGWGSDDEVISAGLQREYTAALCATGFAYEYREYRGFTHMSVLSAPSTLPDDAVAWTAARFAGEPAAVDSCSSG
ncbi:MAG: hypothetical protein DI534_14690 [Leifsonia xyli]|nr:MAG: hypothetical protein DI534_14690 [Leifsonia xyli]